ncbi:alpha-beta hydrolase superfamily lysophospholipase [Angulomicrobium tetraedrale]|uniref:Alpha-beta hydrolase superfamily lysophospholipase n=1 Tax=Ancylobacter tetraedralis TaxID=217068 RepID=A0A839Z734_9HYPH|nr:alpha/beta hydrolase [Ancylobacter tetraedralis]MBB3770216.1 alpha-beta hydrolase superfamily lysophospholipase [Ancylobacter tetraedralis]
MKRLKRLLKLLVGAVLLVFVTFMATRIYFAQSGAPLEPWHTFVPHELSITEIDKGDWGAYLTAEDRIFREVDAEVVQKLDDAERVPSNRYFSGSIVYPPHFTHDWNRSYTLDPQGAVKGAVVLLHGLTDSPYSLRHVARLYADAGYAVVAPRLPGHGTVPAGLTDVEWEDWLAATRLAVREARRRAGPQGELHIVGFSNGGALALKYALDALDDPALARVDRLVLISPMIGITRFARFAGLAGLPAFLPAFAKAAWLAVLPEFNPFKYNSFPVNGARQSHRLTAALQDSIAAQARRGNLGALPPALTFQSVMDFTVSTRAIITAFYALLPDNGSELVLFDINRNTKLGPLLRAATYAALTRMLPPAPRQFRTTIVTNVKGTDEVSEHSVAAGATEETVRPLGLAYPRDVYSLSHVALPFPSSDGLYGSDPDPADDFGLQLGAMAIRGERGALIVNLDTLVRMSSNPFFPYMQQRIGDDIALPPARTPGGAPAMAAPAPTLPAPDAVMPDAAMPEAPETVAP